MKFRNKVRSIYYGWRNAFLSRIGWVRPELESLFDDRLAICNACEHKTAGVCTLCGCPVKKKTKSIMEECPDGRWNPPVYEHNGIQFIVVSDIPEPIRSDFRNWLRGGQMPVLPNVSEAAYVSDWDRYRSKMERETIKL